jgi:hypothetical protein
MLTVRWAAHHGGYMQTCEKEPGLGSSANLAELALLCDTVTCSSGKPKFQKSSDFISDCSDRLQMYFRSSEASEAI